MFYLGCTTTSAPHTPPSTYKSGNVLFRTSLLSSVLWAAADCTFRPRLGLGVIQDFNTLRADTQAKNIAAWTPVIAEVLNGFASFDDQSVSLLALFLGFRLISPCSSLATCLRSIRLQLSS